MDKQAFAKASQAAFNSRDLSALSAMWAEDIAYTGPDGGTTVGKNHSLAREEAIWAGVPDIQVELECFVQDENHAALQGCMTGTHTGTLQTADGTFPPSGNSVKIEFVALFTFKGDLAVSERVYYDRIALATQLGAL